MSLMNQSFPDLDCLLGNSDAPWLDDLAFHEFMLNQHPPLGQAKHLIDTGGRLVKRWERNGTMYDLNRAIDLFQQALSKIDISSDDYAWCLDCLNKAHRRRFGVTKSMTDIDQVIALNSTAVAALPENHVHHATYLYNLSIALNYRFEETGSREDLNRAVSTAQAAVNGTAAEITISDHSSSSHSVEAALELLNLSTALSMGQAMDMFPQSPSVNVRPTRVTCLMQLCQTLGERYQITRLIEDIDRIVSALQECMTLLPENEHKRPQYLSRYIAILTERYDVTGSLGDLDLLISLGAQLQASSDDTLESVNLTALGMMFLTRYQRIGSTQDLDQAIESLEAAATDPQPHCLSGLSMALTSRFERDGLPNDLERAFDLMTEAVKQIPHDNSTYATMLTDYSTILRMRSEISGSSKDLTQSIAKAEEALASSKPDHPRRALMLSGKSNALVVRFLRSGSTDDIDEAIHLSDEAIQMTSPDSPQFAPILITLGNALELRYHRIGGIEDVNRAIKVKEQAVSIISETDPKRGTYLSNLALALRARYNRQKSDNDLRVALDAAEQAVQCTPPSNPARAKFCNNLGMLLEIEFDITENLDQLDRAIVMYHAALSSTSMTPLNHGTHPDQPIILGNLGAALLQRFQKVNSPDDLDDAIIKIEEGLKLSPIDNPSSVILLNHLAKACQLRFERDGTESDLERGLQSLEKSLAVTCTAPSDRLRGITSSLPFLIRHEKQRPKCKDILRSAVQILTTVSPRTLSRSDQQFNVSEFARLTANAVSLSLACGEDPFTALQLLELGKGVLANLQLEVRSDASLLADSYPELAKEFNDLRDQLDSPQTAERSNPEHRHLLSKQFDTLLLTIRELEGFKNFLLGPSEQALKEIAGPNSIIVFNVSQVRSDAFLITADKIRVMQLTFSSQDLDDCAIKFLTAKSDYNSLSHIKQAIHSMNSVLEWLWDRAIGPILVELGYTKSPELSQQWPRIWWVGSDLLNILPLHAAGYHNEPGLKTAADRVISSYSSTVKSLAYARDRLTKVENQHKQNVLLLGMPTTPGIKGHLKFVEKELDDLQVLLPHSNVLQHPTRESVLAALPNYEIVHFSCHGHSAADPSQSSLLFHDWQSNPMTVSDLASINIKSASFAYLSACDASATRDFKLLDESINLSSAIQLSGYASVVGSLWQVADYHSAQVAIDVYKWMLDEGTRLDVRRSAEGLHHAVRALRERTRKTKVGTKVPHDPFIWGPYIHVGI